MLKGKGFKATTIVDSLCDLTSWICNIRVSFYPQALCEGKEGKYQFLTEIYCERDMTWENCETNNFALFAAREVEGKKFNKIVTKTEA